MNEFYTGTDVCDNQNDFNKAFDKALKQNNKDSRKKNKPWVSVLMVILLIFTVWAIVLAMQVERGEKRIMHFIFAFLFSPVYVFSYYLTMLMGQSSSSTSYGSSIDVGFKFF